VLIDLGLAQLADEVQRRLTRTREFAGTLRYLSPEQMLAVAPVDRRSDVYDPLVHPVGRRRMGVWNASGTGPNCPMNNTSWRVVVPGLAVPVGYGSPYRNPSGRPIKPPYRNPPRRPNCN
jgi:serine/threonine protein kinase